MWPHHGMLLSEPDAGECEDTCVTGEPQCPQVRCAAAELEQTLAMGSGVLEIPD